MSNHHPAPSPFAPPSSTGGAPPVASSAEPEWAPPSEPSGPPPYLAGPSGFGPPPYAPQSMGGSGVAAVLGPPTAPPPAGPPTGPIGGSFAPGESRPGRAPKEPARVRPWVSGLAVGALIGAVVASPVPSTSRRSRPAAACSWRISPGRARR